LPVRAYALCIVAGIFVCVALTLRRWRARGGRDEDVWDVAFWAIIFGIIGGRLYHVITDGEKYFGSGRHPIDALKIWDGGLGIWGAVALGVLGAWIGCRRKGIRLTAFADAAAPGSRSPRHRPVGQLVQQRVVRRPDERAVEAADSLLRHCCRACRRLWHRDDRPGVLPADVPVRVALGHRVGVRADLGGSPVDTRPRKRIALYAMGYAAGRAWIEALRSDFAHEFLGVRLNDWTAIVVFLGALVWFHSPPGSSGRVPLHPPARQRNRPQ
jgi:hypothetical protein